MATIHQMPVPQSFPERPAACPALITRTGRAAARRGPRNPQEWQAAFRAAVARAVRDAVARQGLPSAS